MILLYIFGKANSGRFAENFDIHFVMCNKCDWRVGRICIMIILIICIIDFYTRAQKNIPRLIPDNVKNPTCIFKKPDEKIVNRKNRN